MTWRSTLDTQLRLWIFFLSAIFDFFDALLHIWHMREFKFKSLCIPHCSPSLITHEFIQDCTLRAICLQFLPSVQCVLGTAMITVRINHTYILPCCNTIYYVILPLHLSSTKKVSGFAN
jgi:hypothetical protein